MLLFDYLGALYFWVFLAVIRSARGKKSPSFSDVIGGKDSFEADSFIDRHAYGLKLKFIGLIVTGVIILISKEF